MPDDFCHTAFVLSAVNGVAMLVNIHDSSISGTLLKQGVHNLDECQLMASIMHAMREIRGDGMVALDVGANIGTNTIGLAQMIDGWGSILSFEPQERIFYALCGNLTINNVFNARAFNVVVSDHVGKMQIPVPDYRSNFYSGGFSPKGITKNSETFSPELRSLLGKSTTETAQVDVVTIDAMDLARCDAIKIDVEGMELDVLRGAEKIIDRFRPIMQIEHIHVGIEAIVAALPDYVIHPVGMNVICLHKDDPVTPKLRFKVKDA